MALHDNTLAAFVGATKGTKDGEIIGLANPDFVQEVRQMLRTHIGKAAGYSGQDNPDTWANFREAEAWGNTALEGCLIRMGDKYRRVQNLRRNPDNDRVGEPIKDTLRDLANYALIAVCLLEEEEKAAKEASKLPPGGFGPVFREAAKKGEEQV